MTLTYTIGISLNDDGIYHDLSADVVALEWRLGLAASFDDVAAPSWARVTVSSTDARFAPGAPDALALHPGIRLRIISAFEGITTTHFTGLIVRVTPSAGASGLRETVIDAAGLETLLAQAVVCLPPQVSARADQVIAAALDAAALRRPHLAGHWLLGLPEHSVLQTSTRLPEDYPRTLQTGRSIFAYIGDRWGGGIAALEAIRRVVAAERGRFLINRSGEAVFLNRHHLLTTPVPSVVQATAWEYSYGADIVNSVSVAVDPREIGAEGSVLWTSAAPQRLPANSEVEISVAFVDDQRRPVGALVLVPPVRQVDYHANSSSTGSGAVLTASVDVQVIGHDFSAARLRLRNRSTTPAYLLAGARLRGTPLHTGEVLDVQQIDHASAALYGTRRLRLDSSAITSIEDAHQIACFELARCKDPRGRVSALHLSAPDALPALLTQTLFDAIHLDDPHTGHQGDYWIVAEHHHVDLGGARHRAVWTLEPAEASRFWTLSSDALDSSARLAY